MIHRQKFRNVTSTQLDSGTVLLCSQREAYLMETDSIVANTYENMWPSFIWSLFINKDVQEHHGAKIWKFIPQTFRYWWINEVVLTK